MEKRTKSDIVRLIDADYYGFRDDDDGVLEALEHEAEKIAVAKAVAEWESSRFEREQAQGSVKPVAMKDSETEEDEEDAFLAESIAPEEDLKAHVAVPDMKDMENAVVERKKQELMARYASQGLVQNEQEAKQLLNIKR